MMSSIVRYISESESVPGRFRGGYPRIGKPNSLNIFVEWSRVAHLTDESLLVLQSGITPLAIGINVTHSVTNGRQLFDAFLQYRSRDYAVTSSGSRGKNT